jgi:hypothetical protein
MRNRWLGLGLALMMAASAVPARAQYLVSPKGPACAPPDPIPFATSMADAPPGPPPVPMGMFPGNSPNSLPDDAPNASSPPPPPCEHNTFFFSAEYLLWWFRHDQIDSVMVSTSTAPNPISQFGALNQSSTTLLNSSSSHDPRSGVRLTAGYIPDCCICPIEISGFYIPSARAMPR